MTTTITPQPGSASSAATPVLSAEVAHASDLSAWHPVHAFGTFERSVSAGGTKRKV